MTEFGLGDLCGMTHGRKSVTETEAGLDLCGAIWLTNLSVQHSPTIPRHEGKQTKEKLKTFV